MRYSRNIHSYSGLFQRRSLTGERGYILVEVLIGLAIVGLVGVALLSGISTSLNAVAIMDKNSIAKNLAQNQIEYVDRLDYQYDTTTYPLDPQLEIPTGWGVLPTTSEPLHDTDDGIQKIAVTVQRYGKDVCTLMVYKLDI